MDHQSPLLQTALGLAARQHGVVARRQLLARGIPARTITRAIAIYRLFPVYSGVYVVGRPQLSREGALMAALLAAGDGAVLSRRTAAAAWGFLDHRGPIELVRDRRGGRRRARIRVDVEGWWPHLVVHQARELASADVTKKRGLAVTSPARTLLDCSACLPEQRFRWAFMEADRLGLLDDEDLGRCAGFGQGRKGSVLFRQMVDRRIPDITEARSLLEAIALDLARRGEIPGPEVNRRTHAYRPDFRWPDAGVLVEADGYEFHRGREAFENDALRANRLKAEGWTVLRFTWRMLTERPDEVAAMICDAVRRGRPRSPDPK
jgi:very-short-patch-repair endonuclease